MDKEKTGRPPKEEIEQLRKRLSELENIYITDKSMVKSDIMRDKQFFNTISQGIVILDTDNKIISANPAAEKILDLTSEQINERSTLYRNIKMLDENGNKFPLKEQPALVALKTGKNVENVRMGLEYKNGNDIRWININAVPIFDSEKGRITRIHITIHDITNIIKIEEELKQKIDTLTAMNRISKIIQKSDNLDSMLKNVMNEILDIFQCDRAWLLYPCDPNHPTFHVPVESTRPEYPGAFILNEEVPMNTGADVVCQLALDSEVPVPFGPTYPNKIYNDLHDQFSVKSQLVSAIYPKTGLPWLFGLHQCTHDRVWSELDLQLLHEIGLRLTDGLTSMLFLREMRESEEWFKTLSTLTFEGILIHKEGITYDVNETFEKMFGYKREEIIGKNIIEIAVPPDERENMLSKIQQNDTRPYEVNVSRKNGDIFPAEIESRYIDISGEKFRVAAVRDITERKKNELKNKEHLYFLESIEKVENVIRSVENTQESMDKILHVILDIFDCDRAWLLSPCDPDAPYWKVEYERTKPEFPGLFERNTQIKMDEEAASLMRDALESREPVFRILEKGDLQLDPENEFAIKSYLITAIYPKFGKPWEFGLHQCSYPRVWTDTEKKLFKEISDRIGYALGAQLMLNDIRENEEFLNSIFDNIPDMIFVKDAKDLRFLKFNRAGEKLLGYKKEELIGKNDHDFFPKEEADFFTSKDREVLQKKELCNIPEEKIDTRYLGQRILHTQKMPIMDSRGNPKYLLGISNDITEQIEVQEALRKNELKYRRVVENAEEMIYRMDLSGRIIFFNKYAEKLSGRNNEEIANKSFENFIPEDEVDKIWELLSEIIKGKKLQYDARMIRSDGQIVDLEVLAVPYYEDNVITGVLNFARDVTEHRKASKALRESEQKLRTIINQSNDAIYILYNNKFELVNERFTDLTGVTVKIASEENFDFMNIVAPESQDFIKERKEKRNRGEELPGVYEFSVMNLSGDSIPVQVSVSEIDFNNDKAVLGIIRDIREQLKLEEQLRHIQKIESVGHLAGGIAHDFNNLLTPIIGGIEMMRFEMDEDDPRQSALRDILSTAVRASELTRQLLAFSRKQVLNIRVVNFNDLLQNFEKIFRRTIREDVKIEIEYGKKPKPVRLDISQVEQVIMNLLVNAQDAMPQGGKIYIKTQMVEISSDDTENIPEFNPGKYILLTVADTGSGIPKEILNKIFDPFFTTKEIGKGTGLGLSTAFGIVKQHGGHISVSSEMQKGTTFKIYFPIYGNIPIDHEELKEKIDLKSLYGKGKILIVEDQEEVLNIAAKILENFGYDVKVATCGTDAIKILMNQKSNFNLLLSDLIMPGMNGRELYEKLKTIQPDLKVLYMSGYSKEIISQHGMLEEGIEYIQKPLNIEVLGSRVKEVISR